MQTKERHAHAMECYYVTSRRCGALLQWISQVISYTYSQNGRFAPILLDRPNQWSPQSTIADCTRPALRTVLAFLVYLHRFFGNQS